MRFLLLALLLVAGCSEKPSVKPPAAAQLCAVAVWIDVTEAAERGRLQFTQDLEQAFVDDRCLGDDGLLSIGRPVPYTNLHPRLYEYRGVTDVRHRPPILAALRDQWETRFRPGQQLPPPSRWSLENASYEFTRSQFYSSEEWLVGSALASRRRILIIWGDPYNELFGFPGHTNRLSSPDDWRRRGVDPPEIHVYGPSLELHRFLKAKWKDAPAYCFHPPGDRFDMAHYGWKKRSRS